MGQDEKVRETIVSCWNMGDQVEEKSKDNWHHMTVLRPVWNMIKLYSMEDTTLMSDMEMVRKMCEKVMEEECGSSGMTKDPANCKNFMTVKEVGLRDQGSRTRWGRGEWRREGQVTTYRVCSLLGVSSARDRSVRSHRIVRITNWA